MAQEMMDIKAARKSLPRADSVNPASNDGAAKKSASREPRAKKPGTTGKAQGGKMNMKQVQAKKPVMISPSASGQPSMAAQPALPSPTMIGRMKGSIGGKYARK